MLSKNEIYRVQWVILLGCVERLNFKSDDENPEGTEVVGCSEDGG